MGKTNKIAVTKISGDEKRIAIKKAKTPATGAEVSNQIDDPFIELYENLDFIEPTYPLEQLVKLPENNNILQQCIDAYSTNIAGFGYDFRFTLDIESDDIPEKVRNQARQEKQRLETFYKYCNFDTTFTEIMKWGIADRERIGFGAIEVIPNAIGQPAGFEYVPSHTIRMSKLDPNPVDLIAEVAGPDGKIVKIPYRKRFRKYVQISDSNTKRIWFKDFGDPRRMDLETGEFESPGKPVSPENEAHSLIIFDIHIPYSPYGMVRWMGNILSLYGSRKSEEINFNYFINGKHIPLAILVKNGSLTESSVKQLEDYADEIKGVENAHGYLVIEAAGFEDDENFNEASPQGVDIKIEKLTESMQQDGLFQEYDKNNRNKIRSSFRLPPIYTGDSNDYNRATADTAKQIAEEQVFSPEREELAFRLNNLINKALGIKYAELYFKQPAISNKESLTKALDPLVKAGAVTPNMLIHIVSEILGRKIEPIKEDWGNKPMQLTLAELGAKKKEEAESNKTESKEPKEGEEIDESSIDPEE